MSLQIKIRVNDEGVRTLFKYLQRRMRDLRPAMREIGEVVRESVMRNFREQRSPEGERWRPSRRALLQGGLTLVDTATLRNSIHVRPSRRAVAIGTPVDYAATMQFGAKGGAFGEVVAKVKAHRRRLRTGGTTLVRAHTRRMRLPWGDIPPRPFLGVRREDWGEIHDVLMDYLLEARK